MLQRLLIGAVLALSLCGLGAPVQASSAIVRTGSEQLLQAPWVNLIRGKRIAVLAHNASRTHDGKHLVDLLAETPGLRPTMIFAPEHGFRSVDDTLVPDGKDPVTGLPVYSLYGPRKAPTADLLKQVDVVLIDLQDVGLRFYTYGATMAMTLQACKNAGKKAIILDRPNPISGAVVEGAVLEKDMLGPIAAYAPIITRHGMTLGELALLYNDMLGIGADLTVVPMSGWTREMYWDETGLPWTPPSPALPKADQAVLYGAFGTLESLNIAVGRGQTNENAFRVYGAPWISASASQKLAHALESLGLPGLRFSATEWIATRSAYQGKLCRGFRVELLDEHRVEGFRSLLEVLRTMHEVLGHKLKMSGTDAMLGTHWLRKGIESGVSTNALILRAAQESESFMQLRARHLLYP